MAGEDRKGAADGRWKMRKEVDRGRGDSGGDSASARREGRGRGSELGMTPKEIHGAVSGIDEEAFVRAERCSEEAMAEKEAKKRCERMVTEELEEFMVKTPIELVWKEFEEVEENERRRSRATGTGKKE